MDLRDFIVTPFVILSVYAIAYFLRPWLCDEENHGYFFPALSVKVISALLVGLLYKFYYSGGDTYNYHSYGSRIIWNAFVEDPPSGLALIFGSRDLSLTEYTSKILFYTDPSSYFVVRTAAFIDMFTFSTYSATAVVFAFFAFLGTWGLFRSFYELYPHLKGRLALCILFVPSVVFWGSGLLKDTLVISALGFATFAVKRLFIERRVSVLQIISLAISLFIIYKIKIYVLLCFLPAVIFWMYGGNLQKIRSKVLRIMSVPFVITLTVMTGLFVIVKVGENDRRYNITMLAETARVTAYDIAYYTGKNAGSTYSLGELDGSFQSMIRMSPQAVAVSLFRPFLWEVRNPLMLLSAIESFIILVVTVGFIVRWPISFLTSLKDPVIVFCLMFSIAFAFGVGVSTYNFGTLSRYRIPLLPFYLVGLVLITAHRSNSEQNVEVLEATE